MLAAMQCYKVRDHLSEVDDAKLMFYFKEGADGSDDKLFSCSKYQYFLCSSDVILLCVLLHVSNLSA